MNYWVIIGIIEEFLTKNWRGIIEELNYGLIEELRIIEELKKPKREERGGKGKYHLIVSFLHSYPS